MGARTKGYIKELKTGKMKRFLYNPSTFSDSTTVKYNNIESPGCSYPLTQYISGGEMTISVEIFLYDRHKHSKVPEYISFFERFLPKKGKRFSPPSPLLFVFGDYIERCVLVSMERNYQMMDSNLRPVQATIKLSLKKV